MRPKPSKRMPQPWPGLFDTKRRKRDEAVVEAIFRRRTHDEISSTEHLADWCESPTAHMTGFTGTEEVLTALRVGRLPLQQVLVKRNILYGVPDLQYTPTQRFTFEHSQNEAGDIFSTLLLGSGTCRGRCSRRLLFDRRRIWPRHEFNRDKLRGVADSPSRLHRSRIATGTVFKSNRHVAE